MKQIIIIAICVVMITMLIVGINDNIVAIQELRSEAATIEPSGQSEPIVIEKEVIKEVIVEVEKKPNYTYDELYCMAVVIYNEAGGNSSTDEERELVGYVVLNRVNSARYPNTIREVLEQPGQYQGLGNNGVHFAKRSSNAIEAKALDRAWETAKTVLNNRNNIPIPDNVVFQSEFKQGTGVYKQIGNTYFCY